MTTSRAQAGARSRELRLDLRIAESYAFGARDGGNFVHQRSQQFDAVGIVNEVADLAPRQRRHGIEGRVPEQFFPADSAEARRQFAENSGAAKQFGKSLGARRIATVEFSELDKATGAMHNAPGGGELRTDAGVAAHHGVAAEDFDAEGALF